MCIHTHTRHPKNTGIHCPWQFKYAVGPLIFNLDFKRKERNGDDDSYPHLSFICKAALLGMLELDPVRFFLLVGQLLVLAGRRRSRTIMGPEHLETTFPPGSGPAGRLVGSAQGILPASPHWGWLPRVALGLHAPLVTTAPLERSESQARGWAERALLRPSSYSAHPLSLEEVPDFFFLTCYFWTFYSHLLTSLAVNHLLGNYFLY